MAPSLEGGAKAVSAEIRTSAALPTLAALAGILAVTTPAAAQSASNATTTVAPIEVIATTPVPGTRIDIDKAPANIQTLSAADLRREWPGQHHRRPGRPAWPA